MQNDEKQIKDTSKDNNVCKDNNSAKDNKNQISNSKIELPNKSLDKYTFSKNQPTIHLPPIDPKRNTPLYPLPQKPQSNLSNQ